MFVVEKVARGHRDLYLAESVREQGRVRQRLIPPLGRKDHLQANGQLDRLLDSLGRHSELVDFLAHIVPAAMAAGVQVAMALIVLFAVSPPLALAGGASAIALVALYALFHRRFYRLNGALNQQTE